MLERLLGLASTATLLVGSTMGSAAPDGDVAFSFKDPAIVESSGLVTDGTLFVTMNDSGDRGRIFTVDRHGTTVGVTSWTPEPTDVESLAPAGKGHVWVGDTGDNSRARATITVRRVPFGRGDRTVSPTAYELTYPDRAHDAETLLSDPGSGRLYVVSKDIFGGTVYAAPEHLSPDHPNKLTEVAAARSIATDGSFFPDGRHVIVRGYTGATVYSYPGFAAVGSFRLPAQQQGEGMAVAPDGTLYLSSEGQFSDVLRVHLPADIAAAMTASPSAGPEPAVDGEAEGGGRGDGGSSPWPWVLAGVVFVGGAGWLLLRRGQAS